MKSTDAVELTDFMAWQKLARKYGCTYSLYSSMKLRGHYRAYFKGREVGRFDRCLRPESGSGYIDTAAISQLKRSLTRKQRA